LSEIVTQTTDVAFQKPALQSSLSGWSSGKTVAADANIATHADISSGKFFHTGQEAAPWWQVDLQDDFVINQIRIFNRREQSDRLKYFTVLASLTGDPDSWLQLYRKATEAVFGRNNDIPFIIQLEVPCVARFVRIRLDAPGFLHFRKCEIMGYRPDAGEQARLREQTYLRQRHEANEQADLERNLIAGRNGHIVRIGSHIVFVDTDNYSPTLSRVLSNGDYEARERQIIRAVVRSSDRVLEIGTAIGVVTMTLAAIVGPASVATYDANPAIVADARRNFFANKLDQISANVGVMRNQSQWSESEGQTDFFIAKDFWASRLHATADSPGITGVIKIPLILLEKKIIEHRANVLVCDIEGGEADLLINSDLVNIDKIVMETHYWAAGRQMIDAMIQFLIEKGFKINLHHTANHVVVMDRGA
jgi:FkbM family methyltransferase